MTRVGATPGRRRLPRFARRAAALAAAVVLTVVLAQSATSAAFTAQTVDAGNQVSSAPTFCASGGTTSTATTGEDSSDYGTNGNTTSNYGTATSLYVGTSNGGDAHAVLRFDLPPKPHNCSVSSATLRLTATTVQSGGTLNVYRLASAWSASSITWATEPAVTGTPASSASLAVPGPQTWTVTALVTAMYAGPNYGFMIRDSVSLTTGSRFQFYDSFEGATVSNRPKLDITWG